MNISLQKMDSCGKEATETLTNLEKASRENQVSHTPSSKSLVITLLFFKSVALQRVVGIFGLWHRRPSETALVRS